MKFLKDRRRDERNTVLLFQKIIPYSVEKGKKIYESQSQYKI